MPIIYLIQNTLGHSKIGITSKTIEARLAQLMTGNSEHLNVVTTYTTEYPHQLEKMLHRFYGNKRIEREWFLLSQDEVKSFIETCQKLESRIIFLKEHNHYFK